MSPHVPPFAIFFIDIGVRIDTHLSVYHTRGRNQRVPVSTKLLRTRAGTSATASEPMPAVYPWLLVWI